MSAYEDTLIAARFSALAPEPLPADWVDVVRRVRGSRRRAQGLERFEEFEGRRQRLVIVLAVIAAVAVVSATALAVRAFLIDRGYIGIPPKGATASLPTHGELVLSAFGVTRRSRNQVWVYRDGRLLWTRDARHPSGANRHFTGVLEQRLTPQGVELLRSAIVSTGLFGRNRAFAVLRPVPFYNYVEVRDGGRLVRVTWHQHPPWEPRAHSPYPFATRAQVATLQRIVARVTEPESWLPASAWRDREIGAYVPTRFELVYGPWPRDRAYPGILKQLPASAQKLLRKESARRELWQVGSLGDLVPAQAYRFRVTTKKARALRAALTRGGLEVDWVNEDFALAFRVGVHPTAGAITITFLPILPHGEAVSTGR